MKRKDMIHNKIISSFTECDTPKLNITKIKRMKKSFKNKVKVTGKSMNILIKF